MKIRFFTFLALLAFAPTLFADSTTATRVRNFVNDKANSVPITASYMDSEFDNLVTKVNSKVLAKASAPSSPTSGDTWCDTSITPPFCKVYDGSNWTTIAFTKGTDIASASSISIPNDGNFFDVTGTTGITSITAKPAGFFLMLQFDGILTVTDGSNLKLNGNLTTAAETTLTLVSDGTNWFEVSRNPPLSSVTTAMLPAGTVLQVQASTITTSGSTSNTILNDSSIPQDTEGGSVTTVTITPSSASNKYIVMATVQVDTSGDYPVAAIFHNQDGTANAIAVNSISDWGVATPTILTVLAWGTFSNTNAHVFDLRVGADAAATTYWNSNNGTQTFGGKETSSLIVVEVKA